MYARRRPSEGTGIVKRQNETRYLSRRVRHQGERGASLVETALILTFVLLPLLVGMVDLGAAFYSYIAITNASREGARYASHFPYRGPEIREATINEAAAGGIILVESDVLIDPDPPDGALPSDPAVAQPGDVIEVAVEYDYDTIIGVLFGLDTVTLRSGTRMVVFSAYTP